MSSALNYFLAGKYFARIFSLSEQKSVVKNSLQLFRLPESLHNWYFEKNLKNFPDDQVTQVFTVEDDLITANLKLFAELFNRNIQYLDFDYQRIKKFSNGKLDRYKFNLEKSFQTRSFRNKLTKQGISQDLLFDSLSYSPVIDNNPNTVALKELMIEAIFPKFSMPEDIVIISGEMIWSGWITLNTLLDLIPPSKNQKLVVIDVWGVLQQFFSNQSLTKELINSKLPQKFIEEVTLSVLFLTKKDKSTAKILQTNGKTVIKNLFINKDIEKNYSSEVAHKPDYVFVSGSKTKAQPQIPLGIEINRVENLPLSILGKSQLELDFPADVLIQKSEGSGVVWQEDIGQSPVFEEKFVKLKLPKQVSLSVKNGQQVNKEEIIGTRSVLRKLMREKVIAPVKGRINTNYFELGLLKFDSKIDSETLNAPFEGQILEIEKTKYITKLLVDAYTYTIFPAYQRGPDVSGRLVTLKELKLVRGEKVLLVKEKALAEISVELLIKNNIVGIIIVASDYQKLRGFAKRLADHKVPLTIVLLNPFSIKQFEDQNEILFLYTNNTVVLSDKKVSLFLEKNQLKQIYLRLKSRKEKAHNSALAKGEELMVFNYFLQDRYARIEKLSNRNLSLIAQNNLYNTDLNNISKFTVTELNAE